MKRFHGTGWLLFALWCWLGTASDAGAGGLQSQVGDMLQGSGLRDAEVAIVAIDLETGETLIEIEPDQPLLPASNMKLITSAAAIRTLGPSFVFNTELRLIREVSAPDGTGRSGEIDTLVVWGDGDPGFGDPKLLAEHGLDFDDLLERWVEAVRGAGVRTVAELIIDDRVFDRQFVHPTWPKGQLSRWYCAPVAGVNLNNNCFDIFVEPTRSGQSPRITILPRTPFLPTVTRAVTGATDTFSVSRRPGTNELTFWGKVRHKRTQPLYVTVNDPPMLFAKILASRLKEAGVAVGKLSRPQADEQLATGRPLYRVRTTLPLVLRRCNKDSHNLFAEALMKRMGRHLTGATGTWESGAAATRMYLQRVLGVRGAGVTIADGSGLSRDNRVTARILAELLDRVLDDRVVAPLFIESLSISGIDGTLKTRFGPGLAGRVIGKSGYINGVNTLSGYLLPRAYTGTGDRPALPKGGIAFSMLFNNIKPPVKNHQIKEVQQRVLEMIDSMQLNPDAAGVIGVGG